MPPQNVSQKQAAGGSTSGGAGAFGNASLDRLDEAYSFSANRNSEVRFNWCMLCSSGGHELAFPGVVEFATSQGRMKYVRPIYKVPSCAFWRRLVPSGANSLSHTPSVL